MKTKKDRIRRIVKVQQQLEQIASQRLQALERKAEHLKLQETNFLHHMGDHTAYSQRLAPVLSKCLSRVMRQHAVQKTAVSSQETALHVQSVRLRGFEKIGEKENVNEKRVKADQDIIDIVDSAVVRLRTRLP